MEFEIFCAQTLSSEVLRTSHLFLFIFKRTHSKYILICNSINFLGEVTTPQIEALMFPAGAYSSTSSEANLSSPDAEVTIRADLTKVKISVSTPVNSTSATALTSSLPNYDLNKLFSGVQDSGGEGMMAFTPGERWYFVTKIVLTYCEKKLF